MMIITLKLITGELLDFSFEGNRAVIGRSSRCEIVIQHEGLSRQHCVVEMLEGDVYITDLDSTNGVFVDGQKIKPSQQILLQTFLPVTFGPVESLSVAQNLTQSRILQSSQTKFFKRQALKQPKLVRPQVNPVKLPLSTRKTSNGFILNVLIVLLILGAALWVTKNRSSIKNNIKPKDEQKKTIESDYF